MISLLSECSETLNRKKESNFHKSLINGVKNKIVFVLKLSFFVTIRLRNGLFIKTKLSLILIEKGWGQQKIVYFKAFILDLIVIVFLILYYLKKNL
jgi:hypothetical protein